MSSSPSRLSRRMLFAGAGAAGVLAAAVSVLPSVKSVSQATAQPLVKPEKGGGYVLSDHVKHYYKTAQV